MQQATNVEALDFPSGFALMGGELLVEGRYENLEAVSIPPIDPLAPICRLTFPGQIQRGSFG